MFSNKILRDNFSKINFSVSPSRISVSECCRMMTQLLLDFQDSRSTGCYRTITYKLFSIQTLLLCKMCYAKIFITQNVLHKICCGGFPCKTFITKILLRKRISPVKSFTLYRPRFRFFFKINNNLTQVFLLKSKKLNLENSNLETLIQRT